MLEVNCITPSVKSRFDKEEIKNSTSFPQPLEHLDKRKKFGGKNQKPKRRNFDLP